MGPPLVGVGQGVGPLQKKAPRRSGPGGGALTRIVIKTNLSFIEDLWLLINSIQKLQIPSIRGFRISELVFISLFNLSN